MVVLLALVIEKPRKTQASLHPCLPVVWHSVIV